MDLAASCNGVPSLQVFLGLHREPDPTKEFFTNPKTGLDRVLDKLIRNKSEGNHVSALWPPHIAIYIGHLSKAVAFILLSFLSQFGITGGVKTLRRVVYMLQESPGYQSWPRS